MTRRITAAMVGITAFVLLALGIPLAVVVQRSIVSSAVVELQAVAAAALNEIETPIDPAQLAAVAEEPDAPPPFSVYEPSGVRVYGSGPATPDDPTSRALDGLVATSTSSDIIVAAPIITRDEVVLGALRIARPRHEIEQRTLAAWAVMTIAGLVALGVAWLLARRVARRLAEPIEQLAARADNLVEGVDRDELPRSGVVEIDHLADTLHQSSIRITGALERERHFSADASHQLRTPLAGMRLTLEAAHTDAETTALATSLLDDLTRLDATVSHLLSHARQATPTPQPTSLHDLIDGADHRWRDVASATGRRVALVGDTDKRVRISSSTFEQIIDVLVDNALRHGTGTITITARHLTGGAAISVADEGTVPSALTDEDVFRRGVGRDHGIGLALARSLAVAEGARLLLTSRTPTTFTLFLTAPDP